MICTVNSQIQQLTNWCIMSACVNSASRVVWSPSDQIVLFHGFGCEVLKKNTGFYECWTYEMSKIIGTILILVADHLVWHTFGLSNKTLVFVLMACPIWCSIQMVHFQQVANHVKKGNLIFRWIGHLLWSRCHPFESCSWTHRHWATWRNGFRQGFPSPGWGVPVRDLCEAFFFEFDQTPVSTH